MLTLERAFEIWYIHEPGDWENDDGPKEWWAVSNEEGIKAYFGDEIDAVGYQWTKIMQELTL